MKCLAAKCSHSQRQGQTRGFLFVAATTCGSSSGRRCTPSALHTFSAAAAVAVAVTQEGLHRHVAAPQQHAPPEGEVRRDGRVNSVYRLHLRRRELQPGEQGLVLCCGVGEPVMEDGGSGDVLHAWLESSVRLYCGQILPFN